MAPIFYNALVAVEVLPFAWLACILFAPLAYYATRRRSFRGLRVLGWVMILTATVITALSMALESVSIRDFGVLDLLVILLFCGPLALFGAITIWVGYAPPVRRDPPRCARCGYILTGLQEPRCPECGQSFTMPELDGRPGGSR